MKRKHKNSCPNTSLAKPKLICELGNDLRIMTTKNRRPKHKHLTHARNNNWEEIELLWGKAEKELLSKIRNNEPVPSSARGKHRNICLKTLAQKKLKTCPDEISYHSKREEEQFTCENRIIDTSKMPGKRMCKPCRGGMGANGKDEMQYQEEKMFWNELQLKKKMFLSEAGQEADLTIDEIIKNNPDGSITLDAHCWLEDRETGKIIDPSFWQYKICRELNKCYGERKYQEFNLNEADEAKLQAAIKKNYTKQKNKFFMAGYIQAKHDEKLGSPDEQFAHAWRTRVGDTHGHCFMNALSKYIGNEDKYIMRIGSMGWEREAGGIYWEFG